ncbi:hypothetical protein CAP35_12690 [Chitinophagaceae bacterium IBVUCB1]|nr:hypothetical protein CAP35_12690 [Chitinophagaceae bacterium IBVUCB1]
MNTKRLIIILLCCLVTVPLYAQKLADGAAFTKLNVQRIKTNNTGMKILGAWGAANIVGGVTGALVATDKEWQSFHTMNALWGVVNLSIAGMGYAGARKEARENMSCDKMLSRYESGKRLFLINAGLDVIYIGSGMALASYADELDNPARWRGYGKSIMMQGIFLVLFDGTMFALHQHQNKNWYKLLEGVCVTGNGVGFRYTF